MSDWIEHDGKGCPLPVGTWVEFRRADGTVDADTVTPLSTRRSTGEDRTNRIGSYWHWNSVKRNAPSKWHLRIIAYRTPSAKHVEALREIAREPGTVRARIDA